MALWRDPGRLVLALVLLWLGIRHLTWSGSRLHRLGLDAAAPQHTLAHVLALGCLNRQRRRSRPRA